MQVLYVIFFFPSLAYMGTEGATGWTEAACVAIAVLANGIYYVVVSRGLQAFLNRSDG